MLPATKKNPLRSSGEVKGFNQNWNFSTDFHKKKEVPISNFTKLPPVAAALFYYGQMDGQDED
jgi:hypothetical protein